MLKDAAKRVFIRKDRRRYSRKRAKIWQMFVATFWPTFTGGGRQTDLLQRAGAGRQDAGERPRPGLKWAEVRAGQGATPEPGQRVTIYFFFCF